MARCEGIIKLTPTGMISKTEIESKIVCDIELTTDSLGIIIVNDGITVIDTLESLWKVMRYLSDRSKGTFVLSVYDHTESFRKDDMVTAVVYGSISDNHLNLTAYGFNRDGNSIKYEMAKNFCEGKKCKVHENKKLKNFLINPNFNNSIMSALSGATAFLSKNKIFGAAADIVRAAMVAAVTLSESTPAPAKGKAKTAEKKAAPKGKGAKAKEPKVEEATVSEVTFVKSWTGAKGNAVSLIVGPSQEAVAEVRDAINGDIDGGGIAKAFNAELKKAGYTAIAIPENRKKLVTAAEKYFKDNKMPIVSNLEELGSEEAMDATEEEKPKSTKGKKGKKQVDESEEPAADEEDEEADEGDEEADEEGDEDAGSADEESSEEKPPKKGADKKGKKGGK